MSNKKNQQNIPEGWRNERLGDMLDHIVDNRGKTPPVQTHGVPLVEVNSVGGKKIDYSSITKYVSEEVYNSWFRKYLKKGDVLFSTVGRTASCSLYDESIKSAVAQNLIGLRFKSDCSEFMYYLLSQDSNNRKFKKIEMLGAQPSVKVTQMVDLFFIVPEEDEKRRIVKVLETWDEAIDKLDRVIEVKKDVKKGLMQKLLTGELRLPGFQGEWVTYKLGDLYEITSSKRVFQSEWTTEGVPFYRAREIVKLANNGYVNNDLYISEKMFSDYKLKYGAPESNDLLVTGVGTIGRVYRVRENDNFYFKDGNIVWLKHKEGVSSEFVEQLFNTRDIKKQVIGSSPITTVATYTIDAAKKTKVNIPDIDEQIEIAKVLTSFDLQLQLLVNKRKKMSDQKKYLLNNLITGQIRTPENL